MSNPSLKRNLSVRREEKGNRITLFVQHSTGRAGVGFEKSTDSNNSILEKRCKEIVERIIELGWASDHKSIECIYCSASSTSYPTTPCSCLVNKVDKKKKKK